MLEFPLILNEPDIKLRDILEKKLNQEKIEFRRGNAGGGNQLRQPYLKNYVKNINLKKFKEVDHVHFFGMYIGNFPDLSKEEVIQVIDLINSAI